MPLRQQLNTFSIGSSGGSRFAAITQRIRQFHGLDPDRNARVMVNAKVECDQGLADQVMAAL